MGIMSATTHSTARNGLAGSAKTLARFVMNQQDSKYPAACRGQLIRGQIYTICLFAHRLEVHIDTVTRWIREGCPVIRDEGGTWICVNAWEEWMQKRMASRTEP